MNVIAVDDEHFALMGLEMAIRDALPDCTLSSFDMPEDALEYAKANRVDLAFLDVEMGGMNGLELAKALKDVCGKTNIVFATGYSKYAIDSYEVDTSDYLLKPVTKEKIERAMDRLRDPVDNKLTSRVYVQTFGNFEVFKIGKPLIFNRQKSKELFAYLIDRQGTSVTTAEIAAVLWEDKPYDTSIKNQVQVAISDMLKALKEHGVEDIIIKNHNQISVDRAKISCDYYDLLQGNTSAVNAFCGEYMTNYGWAELTTGALSQKTNIL